MFAVATAPAARLLLVTAPLGTPAAIIANPEDVRRWSGDSMAKPLVPSLNQIRSRTSELVNTNGLTGCMLGSPRTTVNSPRLTRFVTAWLGWPPPTLEPSLLQNETVPLLLTSANLKRPAPL